MPDISVTRICLVTEELSYAKGSGGIGGAFHELALALRRAEHRVALTTERLELPFTKSVEALGLNKRETKLEHANVSTSEVHYDETPLA